MPCLITIPELADISMSFDVVRVDRSPEARVTEHPVEQGAEVTDHVQVMSERLTVEVMVSDTPLAPLRPLQPPNVDAAIVFLEQAQGKLLNVSIDGEGTWDNCVLTSWPHSRTVVRGRPFPLALKQIRIASAISVTIPPRQPAPVAQVGAPTEAPLGQQATTAGVPTSTLSVTKDVLTGALSSAFKGWW